MVRKIYFLKCSVQSNIVGVIGQKNRLYLIREGVKDEQVHRGALLLKIELSRCAEDPESPPKLGTNCIFFNTAIIHYTECPRSSDPLYLVTLILKYKMGTTSWTDGSQPKKYGRSTMKRIKYIIKRT